METIQEGDVVPGSPPPPVASAAASSGAAGDHRTYSNPAFQGWVGLCAWLGIGIGIGMGGRVAFLRIPFASAPFGGIRFDPGGPFSGACPREIAPSRRLNYGVLEVAVRIYQQLMNFF